MSAGYGRGFYGSEQLARPRSGGGSGGGWFKIAVVAGLGAAIWWWVLPAIGPKSKLKHAEPPPVDELEQLARSRGFASAQEYQDAVRAMVDELEARGAKVEVAPHLKGSVA